MLMGVKGLIANLITNLFLKLLVGKSFLAANSKNIDGITLDKDKLFIDFDSIPRFAELSEKKLMNVPLISFVKLTYEECSNGRLVFKVNLSPN
jgi:hypothetical protein